MTRKLHSLGDVSALTDKLSGRLFFKPVKTLYNRVPAGLHIDVRSILLSEWEKLTVYKGDVCTMLHCQHRGRPGIRYGLKRFRLH